MWELKQWWRQCDTDNAEHIAPASLIWLEYFYAFSSLLDLFSFSTRIFYIRRHVLSVFTAYSRILGSSRLVLLIWRYHALFRPILSFNFARNESCGGVSDSLRLSLRLRLFIGSIEPISGLSWPNFLYIKAHSQVHSRYFLVSQFYHFDCTQFDSYRHLGLY